MGINPLWRMMSIFCRNGIVEC